MTVEQCLQFGIIFVEPHLNHKPIVFQSKWLTDQKKWVRTYAASGMTTCKEIANQKTQKYGPVYCDHDRVLFCCIILECFGDKSLQR